METERRHTGWRWLTYSRQKRRASGGVMDGTRLGWFEAARGDRANITELPGFFVVCSGLMMPLLATPRRFGARACGLIIRSNGVQPQGRVAMLSTTSHVAGRQMRACRAKQRYAPTILPQRSVCRRSLERLCVTHWH